MTTAATEIRQFLQRKRDEAAEEVDRLEAKLQAMVTWNDLEAAKTALAEWDDALAQLPAEKLTAAEQIEQIMPAVVAKREAELAGPPTTRVADRDDPGPIPAALDVRNRRAAE